MNTNPSMKYLALSILKEKQDWIYGGQLDRMVYSACEGVHKEAICHRRIQELAKDGYKTPYGKLRILRRLVPFEGKKVVQYKYDFDTEVQLKEARDREALRFAAGI